MKRYLFKAIQEDLKEKMVFIGGPRQVGKTTLSMDFLSSQKETHPAYLNWDHLQTRAKLLKGELPPDEKLLVLNEIHKFTAKEGTLCRGAITTIGSIHLRLMRFFQRPLLKMQIISFALEVFLNPFSRGILVIGADGKTREMQESFMMI